MTGSGIRLWSVAIFAAIVIHAGLYALTITFPGGDVIYQGGGSFDQAGKTSQGAGGVFVQLGNSADSAGDTARPVSREEQGQDQESQQTLAQGGGLEDDAPGAGDEKSEPQQPAVAESESLTETAVAAPEPDLAKEIAKKPIRPNKKFASVPKPTTKPRRRDLIPELETLGRRMSVQGPLETAKPGQPEKPAETKTQSAKANSGKSAQKGSASASLAFVNRGGGQGDASSNREGEIRALNYEDMVLLWLKRFGQYPYEAAMWRLEDTVTLKFAINRQGEILYHFLVKESQYPLLNQAIKQMMSRASPVPPIPPEIAGKEMTFTIPVHFDPNLR